MATAMNVSDHASDHLAELRPNYIARLRKRADTLNAFLQAIDQDDANDESYEEGHRCVHSMISSAAIFGYPDLSVAARAAEAAFETDDGQRAAAVKSCVEHVLELTNSVIEAAAIGDI